MAKRKPKPWGIWVTNSKQWMTTDGGRRKARYEFKRDAAKEFKYGNDLPEETEETEDG